MTSGLVVSQVSLSSSILGNRLQALKYRMFKFETFVALFEVELKPTSLLCFMLPPELAAPKKNDLWIQGSGETPG